MGSLDHPVLRAIMIFSAALGLTQIYISLGGYLNWPPFGKYPDFGSPAYIAVYVVSLIVFGAIDWIRFRGHERKSLIQQGVVQR